MNKQIKSYEVTQVWVKDLFIHLRDEAKSLGVENVGQPDKVTDWEPYQDAAHSAHAIGMLIASAMNQVRKADVVDVLETPIKELGLPWMYRHRLERCRILTVEQLTEMSQRELSCKRNIGEKCISLVKEALSRRGLSLADD